MNDFCKLQCGSYFAKQIILGIAKFSICIEKIKTSHWESTKKEGN